MCEKKSEDIKSYLPDWDYKDVLYLEPCKDYDPEDGTYDLYMRIPLILEDLEIKLSDLMRCMKQRMTYEGDLRSEDFICVAKLDVCNLYDLYWNICEKLDVEHAREDLKEQFKKEEN